MSCVESAQLENLWKRRYELANLVERGGLFAVHGTKTSHALTLRLHRARQAQAASALQTHQRECPLCQGEQNVMAHTRAS